MDKMRHLLQRIHCNNNKWWNISFVNTDLYFLYSLCWLFRCIPIHTRCPNNMILQDTINIAAPSVLRTKIALADNISDVYLIICYIRGISNSAINIPSKNKDIRQFVQLTRVWNLTELRISIILDQLNIVVYGINLLQLGDKSCMKHQITLCWVWYDVIGLPPIYYYNPIRKWLILYYQEQEQEWLISWAIVEHKYVAYELWTDKMLLRKKISRVFPTKR